MSTQEAAVIALKTCKSICSDIKCCNPMVCDLNQYMVKMMNIPHDLTVAVNWQITAQECIHEITMACNL